MLNVKTTSGLIETLILSGFMASAVVSVYGLVVNKASASFAGSIGVCGSLYGFKKGSESEKENKTVEELINAQTTLRDSLETVQTLQNEVTYTRTVESALRANFEQVSDRYNAVVKEVAETNSKLETLLPENTELKSKVEQWRIKFDEIFNEHDRDISKKDNEIEALKLAVTDLQRDLMGYEARSASVDEVAKLRAESKLKQLEDQIQALTQQKARIDAEFVETANAYNQVRETLLQTNDHYESELGELKEVVTKSLPSHFDSVLSERDREMLRIAGMVGEMQKPHKFEQVGEFSRADKIIDILFNSEERLTLDASEIVPIDYTRFEAFYNLRDRKSKGKALIEHLDSLGETIFSELACIKPIKFEFDAVNPHRIKAVFIHKQQKAEPKTSIDKLWIPSSQFNKVAGMLKKPMTRVMGATGEGKGIFVNLLLATEANSANPASVRLHDPMDSSEEDFWQIPKTSKGKSETTKAIKFFVDEFNDRLEKGVSTPKTLDVFDEIDIVASSDSGINKDLVAASKGMRHNGMRAYVIGQSPSVAKKGMEWSDFDNVNAVYFGTSITTAIDKTPALETQIETLKKTHDKLKDFCQKQNEELGLEGWNEYRIGLLVTRGKATFFEMPNADSILCDWSNLERKTAPSETEVTDSKPGVECQHADSVVKKTYKDEAGNPIRQNRKCKECGASFTVSL